MTSNIKIKHLSKESTIKTTRSKDYREITGDRIVVGFREGYFIYVVQNEVFDTNVEEQEDDVQYFIDEIQIKVSPQQMKKTHGLLGRLIEEYENIFGEITSLEEGAFENPDLVEES